MPATASRIGFIMQQYRRAAAFSAPVKERYGSLARQTEDPVETFFDSVDDAQRVANARQSLMGGDRRRFNVQVNSLGEVLALNYIGTVPVLPYVDPERQCAFPAVVCEIVYNFGRQSASMTIWG